MYLFKQSIRETKKLQENWNVRAEDTVTIFLITTSWSSGEDEKR